MANEILGTDVVVQIGIIVRDIEKTAKDFAQFFGVEVPQIIETEGYEKHTQSIEESLQMPEQNLHFQKL